MKRHIKFISLIFILLASNISAQEHEPSVLNKALSLRGLTKYDLTIPIDTSDQPNTNQCRLILPVVYELMTNSISSFEFMDRVMEYKDLSVYDMVLRLFKDINYYKSITTETYSFDTDINRLAELIVERVKQPDSDGQKLPGVFTNEEKAFLKKNLLTYFISSDGEDLSMTDIYKFNESQDTAESNAKKLLDILSKVDREEIFSNSIGDFTFYYELYKYLSDNKQFIISNNEGKEYYYKLEKDELNILIGGTGSNKYSGYYDVIIDFGGNDTYNPNREEKLSNNFNCIIDLGGNDLYSSKSNFSLGAGVFSSGFIFDYEGDDTYRASNVNLGAAIGGLGLILDENGGDIYEGINFSIGAGMFGAGLIYDCAGNDFYIANSYSQGFGMTEGIGAIVDKKGNDSYLISPVTIDINRYNDHYLSMCQGYGFGLRPYYAGGIGYIVEAEGNDVYSCDIFGQGGSYWYSLGVIADKSGNDKYSGFHYNQGSGIHFSVGLHKDYEGWDYYSSNWVSQGCGHDYGVGILWDVSGNDLYSCDGLSQGAGNANGIGILIDENGRDGYLSKDFNTRGYGQPLRNFGSIGILADASGHDFYSNSGEDSTVLYSSKWGIGLDDGYADIVNQTPQAEYKIEVDTGKTYSTEDYYIFARTLEIKFSKFAQFGFERLVSDSVNTADYMFAKIGSADIRDVVLMRNLNARMGYTLSNLLISKLADYLSGKSQFNTDEIGYMCYLIGDSKNKNAKEILLQLTYNENIRVRSSAISALGKLDFQKEDSDFVSKVSERLVTLAKEKNASKLYNKEIAFALNKFMQENAVPVLIDMMNYNYYGVRFTAAEVLKLNTNIYNKYAESSLHSENAKELPWLTAFIYSIYNLNEDEIESLVNTVLESGSSNNEAVLINIAELVKNKMKSSGNKDFKKWGNKVVNDIMHKTQLRNK